MLAGNFGPQRSFSCGETCAELLIGNIMKRPYVADYGDGGPAFARPELRAASPIIVPEAPAERAF